jgi:hypothetical protein
VIVEPYTYVRTITLGLGTLWTLGGIVRTVRFARRWHSRLAPLGLSDRWLRKQVLRFVLRATVLDPINLALLLVLLGSWSLRAVL